jgi:predicted transcriptional regulator
MKKRVLLSIHPEFANAILDGRKHFEFRRVLFREEVNEVVVYATSPIARVIGRFRIDAIYQDAPKALWNRTNSLGGVTKEKFDRYFQGRSTAFAIKITNPVRFASPQPLSKYISSSQPPQSFCYL